MELTQNRYDVLVSLLIIRKMLGRTLRFLRKLLLKVFFSLKHRMIRITDSPFNSSDEVVFNPKVKKEC